jgi:hypothetical protein
VGITHIKVELLVVQGLVQDSCVLLSD